MRCGAEITFHDISRLTGRFLLRYADILRLRLAFAQRPGASAADTALLAKAEALAAGAMAEEDQEAKSTSEQTTAAAENGKGEDGRE